jgi:hypothetical protein
VVVRASSHPVWLIARDRWQHLPARRLSARAGPGRPTGGAFVRRYRSMS